MNKYYLVENKDLKLENKVRKTYANLKLKITEKQDAYGYVTTCMENVNIDKKTAFKYIQDNENNPDEIENYELVTENFEDKFAIVDKTSNRLHNNLTNLYSPLRQFLTYNGENIVQCDIRNSQLVFLYVMLKNYHIPEKELRYFGEVVCKIGFYEFFAEKLGKKLTEENRKEFKTFIFRDILFGESKLKLNEIEIIFKKIFPSIFHVMRSIKMESQKALPVMLQKAESEFIFKCVEKIGTKIPLLTIHDSIGTTSGNENIIKKAIEQEFLENYGLTPKIRVEKFAK